MYPFYAIVEGARRLFWSRVNNLEYARMAAVMEFQGSWVDAVYPAQLEGRER